MTPSDRHREKARELIDNLEYRHVIDEHVIWNGLDPWKDVAIEAAAKIIAQAESDLIKRMTEPSEEMRAAVLSSPSAMRAWHVMLCQFARESNIELEETGDG